MKRILLFSLILLTVCALIFTGCTKDPGRIILKLGDSNPDRSGGYGAVYDRINAEFKKVHPNVDFEVESLTDNSYYEKIRIYATANQLPDVFQWWTFPSNMNPLISAGRLERLNKNDFAAFDYIPGALESCEYDGVFYGVPTSCDMWVLFVNKALFEKAGVQYPTSWEDIVDSVPKFRAQNITPLVTSGQDGWPLSLMYDGILQKINGDFNRSFNAVERKGGVRFTDPDFIQAAKYIQDLVNAGVFNANLTTSDYGNAQNQFVQERAAMYMMGSWEMGMATNPTFPESFRNNLDVIKYPVIRGGRGGADDNVVWFGGNVVVSANSKNKALALEYIKFLAERFGSYCWEMGASFPAQKITPLASDTNVSKKMLQFSADTKSVSGMAVSESGKTEAFGGEYQELMRQLCSLLITPEDFCQRLDAAAELDSKQ